MITLRKTLLFILVICTLGYGSAWAYDGHAVAIENDATTDVLPQGGSDIAQDHDMNDHGSEQLAEVDCDHCGHLSAHLQVVFAQNGYLCSVNRSSELLEFSEDFTSFIISPDRRPPRV